MAYQFVSKLSVLTQRYANQASLNLSRSQAAGLCTMRTDESVSHLIILYTGVRAKKRMVEECKAKEMALA